MGLHRVHWQKRRCVSNITVYRYENITDYHLRPGNQHHSLHCGNLYPTTIELEVVGGAGVDHGWQVRPGDENMQCPS